MNFGIYIFQQLIENRLLGPSFNNFEELKKFIEINKEDKIDFLNDEIEEYEELMEAEDEERIQEFVDKIMGVNEDHDED